jgi:hypothetical protein
MKLSASFLLVASTLAAAQARSSLRRELAEDVSPTYMPTDFSEFNATDDDASSMPEEAAPAEEHMAVAAEETATSSTVGASAEEGMSPVAMDEPPAKPEEGVDETMAEPDLFKPESNDTVAEMDEKPAPKHEKPERNDTMMADEPLHLHNDNETLPVGGPKHNGLKPEGNSSMAAMNEKERPGPKGFQDLVDDKCATFVCPSSSNSTCPSPPGAEDVNGTDVTPPSKPEPLDKNMTAELGPPEPLDMNMTYDDDDDTTSPPEPLLAINTTQDMGPPNMTGPTEEGPSDGPKHSPERALKPSHHKPEDLLACACCEGATVEEIAQTGVDTSGLAFLVGYDPSAATVYDNASSRLNSLVVSSVVFGAVLALFL